ncbi:hypothetical protein CV102_21905 [Natronococcus pandeyae]|uniref:SHSP domain-containing protein n=1 Tax=Natronococcus pandeyae TaxID=2055836 RepID=A0A8J8PZF6_9EURY|nr:Hsp20/alpha crystallin family protein [Natronococcus pandeyae]TYL36482.1 hypothetical protein CV102_21905 [Natronococcus pandeyae]
MGIDLADHGAEFDLTADVPGFERDDIDLRLADTTVHITAEHGEAETEEREEFSIKSERERRSLSRSVRLPESVDADAVEATYKNGVLTVMLPKIEPSEVDGQMIDIKADRVRCRSSARLAPERRPTDHSTHVDVLPWSYLGDPRVRDRVRLQVGRSPTER